MNEEQRFYELLERVYWSIQSTKVNWRDVTSKPKLVYYLKMEGFSESEIKMLML